MYWADSFNISFRRYAWEQARAIVSELGAPSSRRRRRSDVQRALKQAAISGQPVSLEEIAADLGYRSITSLRRHDRDTCSIISKRHNAVLTKRPRNLAEQQSLNRVIRERLEGALKQDSPPSVRSIAIALGFSNSNSLHCRFPDSCNKLVAAAAAARNERRSPIEACLRAALAENPPPILKAVAERLRRKDVQSLRLWFPDMCRQVRERWREDSLKRIREAGAALERAVDTDPPGSGDLIARRNGIAPSYLAALFPGAWRRLKARIAAARKQAFAVKCERLRREVRTIAADLCRHGIYPACRLVKGLVISDYRSEDVIGIEIRRFMTELKATGLAHQTPDR